MNVVTTTVIKSKEKVFILVGRVYKNLIEKVKLQLDLEDQIKKSGTFQGEWQESPVRQKKQKQKQKQGSFATWSLKTALSPIVNPLAPCQVEGELE